MGASIDYSPYARLTHHHPQPLLGKEGGIPAAPVVRTPRLTKEGLGVRKVSDYL